MVIRIAAIYILLGALAKVLWGAPSDLPAALLQALQWDEQNLFDTVIFVELFVAGLALVSPRIGWSVIIAALTGFLLVLLQQLLAGEESCGCFGSTFSVPTPIMLGIDLLALICITIVQPWASLQTTPWRIWGVIPAPFLAVLGVWYVHSATIAPVQILPDMKVSISENQQLNQLDNKKIDNDALPSIIIPKEPIVESNWRLPSRFPRNIKLHPPDWINKPLHEIALATWVDTAKMPDDCSIIFYYDTCTHCKEHIDSLASSADEVNLVFVQLPTAPNSGFEKIIQSLPKGLHLKLPAGPRWQIKTPWEVTVEGGIVVDAAPGF